MNSKVGGAACCVGWWLWRRCTSGSSGRTCTSPTHDLEAHAKSVVGTQGTQNVDPSVSPGSKAPLRSRHDPPTYNPGEALDRVEKVHDPHSIVAHALHLHHKQGHMRRPLALQHSFILTRHALKPWVVGMQKPCARQEQGGALGWRTTRSKGLAGTTCTVGGRTTTSKTLYAYTRAQTRLSRGQHRPTHWCATHLRSWHR